MTNKFQSPDGDFVYSDEAWLEWISLDESSFNPLTGISSILTRDPCHPGEDPRRVSIP